MIDLSNACRYVSFAVALLQLDEAGAATVAQLGELKREALSTLFGELAKEKTNPTGHPAGCDCPDCEDNEDDREDQKGGMSGAERFH